MHVVDDLLDVLKTLHESLVADSVGEEIRDLLGHITIVVRIDVYEFDHRLASYAFGHTSLLMSLLCRIEKNVDLTSIAELKLVPSTP